jgi:vancomycin resistance protein YoaR
MGDRAARRAIVDPLHRSRRLGLLVVGALAGAVVLLGAAWALDSRAHDGRVVRGVALAGREVGGMRPAELTAYVDDIATRYEQAAIEVRAPEGGFRSDSRELGLSVDRPGTVAGVLDEGRKGALPARVWDWARHLFGSRTAEVDLHVDRPLVTRVVTENDPARVPPVEPFLSVRDGRLSGVSGRPGRGIQPEAVERALTRADLGQVPVAVDVGRGLIQPRFRREDADRVAAQGEELAAAGFKVQAGPKEATVPPEMLRRWLKSEVAGDTLRLAPETGPIAEDLAKLFPNAVVPPVDAGFAVSGRSVSVTPAKAGSGCCAPEAVPAVANALNGTPPSAPVSLPLKTIPARRDESEARKLGIVEQVATFTTPHAAGELRVRNIHLIADMLRGTVIAPGQTFSVNSAVGPRTTEKGFVAAPVIGEDNKFESSPGGGISQFATTLFNAAFFAGLEIPEYQMHTLYISRYPFGREATLSYPRPDLKVRNSSPYGILVWPTYTGGSITVNLYSTRWVEATQSGQTTTERGPCKAVTTERTRKFTDGRTAVDRFNALYAPEQGVKCT